MAIHPLNDQLKIKIDKDKYDLSTDKVREEQGTVVEVPDLLIYLSFHSFAFEESIVNDEKLKKVREFYKNLEGKRVWWEPLKDSGRRMQEGEDEFIYLKMTDVIAYSDDNDKAKIVSDLSSAGSFNL